MTAPVIGSMPAGPEACPHFQALREGTTPPAAAPLTAAGQESTWTLLKHFCVQHILLYFSFSALVPLSLPCPQRTHLCQLMCSCLHSSLNSLVLPACQVLPGLTALLAGPALRPALHTAFPISPHISVSTSMPPFCPDSLPLQKYPDYEMNYLWLWGHLWVKSLFYFLIQSNYRCVLSFLHYHFKIDMHLGPL